MQLAYEAAVCFFNDTATTEIYTLSLHDALPISAELLDPFPGAGRGRQHLRFPDAVLREQPAEVRGALRHRRSEEHTSELQSRQYLVCRLLLEKKNRRRTSEQP